MARDLLGEGLAALNGWRNASMARTVTYQRGSDSVEIAATPGDEPGDDGTAPAFVGRYYKLDAADLVLGGIQVEPEVDDVIIETVDGVAVTYTVRAGDGRPLFEWVEDRRAIKVRTKRADALSEMVTYYPGGHLFDPRSLRVHVDRSAEAALLAFGDDVRGLHAVLRIPRGSGTGRLEEVRSSEDLVDIDLQRTGTPLRCRVERIVANNNPGFWLIAVVGGGSAA